MFGTNYPKIANGTDDVLAKWLTVVTLVVFQPLLLVAGGRPLLMGGQRRVGRHLKVAGL